MEFPGFSTAPEYWTMLIMTPTFCIGKSKENNFGGGELSAFSRKGNLRVKEGDEVSDPPFLLASVSSSFPGGGGARGAQCSFLRRHFLRLSLLQTSSCLQLLSQAVRGCPLPTMFLHLPGWILFWATSVLISPVMLSQLTTEIITYLFWSNQIIEILFHRIADFAGKGDIAGTEFLRGTANQGAHRRPYLWGWWGEAEMTATSSHARPKISASFPSVGAELWEGCSQTVSQVSYKVHGNVGKGAEDSTTAKSNTVTSILFPLIST